ncbi:uncharacterized protein LOC113296079 [Papaver somniferum]|uniref:uncharacterized protein LOC113296079 n=1 Tax=Papaver somniferum TaxID=3469 RepID=UPI000E70447D|nr:uncharacterized protein LOC113296079 [Papaver somniferum]
MGGQGAQTNKDLQDTQKKQQTHIDKTNQDVLDMKEQLNQILLQLQNVNNKDSNQGESFVAPAEGSIVPAVNQLTENRSFNNYNQFPNLYFPRFDGTNPKGWIQKCERFFLLHNIREETQKVQMAAVHMDGKAERWNFNLQTHRFILCWFELAEQACFRFENTSNDNIVGMFNKLAHTTTVYEFFDEFEVGRSLMMTIHPEFPERYYVMSFIGDLKEEIKYNVLMFNPTTLMRDFALARLQEHSLPNQQKQSKPTPNFFSNSFSMGKKNYQSSFPPKPLSIPLSIPKPPLPPLTPKTSPTHPPIKRLTPEQLKIIKAQGLFYNCDEVYRRGHEEESASPVDSDIEISLHALTGTHSSETIRIPGVLNKHSISILIDTGSTHSFIDSSLAQKLNYNVQPTSHMAVTVANGDKTVSSGIFKSLNWFMQGHSFSADLRLPPLGGCDIVLGVDWLRLMGNVLFNFTTLTVSFIYQDTEISLTGISNSPLLKKNPHGLCAQLSSISDAPSPSPPPPKVAALLQDFQDVFEEPSTLPPHRSLDHTIPLKPNSTPVNQRPYKCPYVQKSVIEDLIQDMLHQGIIQPSHDPFASPILLVKKKDNNWIFCVDYRILNDIIIKDKFPIPIIDELLDELHGVAVFTKIDLSKPLTELLKKNAFVWSAAATNAFNQLKLEMTTTHVLALPDFSKNRNKHENTFPAGLLQPLLIPDQAWQYISMDFIEGLPKSEHKDGILVVVDRLTKYSHFIVLQHPYTAVTVAKAFLHHIFKLHGLPSSIISDRDKVFTTTIEEYLTHRNAMLDILKESLSGAQDRMKFFAD